MNTAEYNRSVDLYADALYRFILKSIKDSEKAKDIVQDTYEKVWIKKETIDASKAKSYMFTAAYRTMIDTIRKDKKEVGLDLANTSGMLHHIQYSDLSEILNEALEKLPEVQKSVILLRDYEGYNYSEIGEITGLNESQVKVYIYRARIALKEYLVSMEKVI
jgi:RNA polymerase sigma factor (sigma-70 family)